MPRPTNPNIGSSTTGGISKAAILFPNDKRPKASFGVPTHPPASQLA
jgi:hypothetical protein